MFAIKGMVYTKDCVFAPGKITIEEGMIQDVQTLERTELTLQEQGQYLMPGLVDVHFHGAAGYDLCDGTKEGLQAIIAYENEHGITTICPATMSLPVTELEQILAVAAEWKKEQTALTGMAYKTQAQNLCGIHLEGPFIAKEKKGAQKGEYIFPADKDVLLGLQEKADGLIKLVTIAPEVEGAMGCIKELKDEFHFSIGHTMADYETACKAFEAGANHVTHIFNAMPGATHREPSVLGAAADNENVYVELICDGIHIHPVMVRSAFKLFGEDRIVLISDSMRATGVKTSLTESDASKTASEECFTLGGQNVTVNGALATLEDGTIAGSVTNLYDCMKNAVSMGIPKEVAIKAATINPARSIGVDREVGSLEVGKRADILVADEELRVETVIIGGKKYI